MIKKLKVTVDSKTYEVSVEVLAESTSEAAPPAASPVAAPISDVLAVKSSGPGDVVSPLAGRVVSIGVKVGQTVKEGDHVLTLEAMKMNTFVFAPKNGTIKEIKAQVGSGVQEGDVLLTMD